MISKSNKYTILIVILSVLLAISLIAGSTFAWFISTDIASRNITLGDPVELNIVDENNDIIEGDGHNLPITISGSKLMPGMQINVLSRVKFTLSNTPAILRAKIVVNISNTTAPDVEDWEAVLQSDVHSIVNDTAGQMWVYNAADEWWYYIGANEILAPVNQTELQTINTAGSEAARTITFINDSFNFPSELGNDYANAHVTFMVTFQGIQAYLPAFDGALSGENQIINGFSYRINKIVHVYEIFNEAFGG